MSSLRIVSSWGELSLGGGWWMGGFNWILVQVFRLKLDNDSGDYNILKLDLESIGSSLGID